MKLIKVIFMHDWLIDVFSYDVIMIIFIFNMIYVKWSEYLMINDFIMIE